jgi:CRP-like cAMP-binding protein
MDALPRFLQYGEEVSFSSHATIFRCGEPIGVKPVFYVIAGLLKVEYPVRDSTFTLWLPPESIIGLVEPLAECSRLCTVHAMERTICYAWDLEGFFTAAGVSWELGFAATKGMARELRILNAEFGQRLGILEKGVH